MGTEVKKAVLNSSESFPVELKTGQKQEWDLGDGFQAVMEDYQGYHYLPHTMIGVKSPDESIVFTLIQPVHGEYREQVEVKISNKSVEIFGVTLHK